MSVEVQQLTKVYGQQKAVDNISFSVKKGEIVGFLGPNGAGKTTTMKIVSCFMPPTQGTATVCGYDVQQNSLEVRQSIGYLPEHNPLYHDMYVRESLQFIAGLHGIKNSKAQIEKMIQVTGLEQEQKKKIGQLSKGYKQRVGLAQAMIHEPKVLILDEPTSGLDPNQLLEIRQLIKMLGEEKTVILSTHIMQEVQALCSRVLIIDKGSIVADDSIQNIHQKASQQRVIIVEFAENIDKKALQKLPNITKIEALDNHKWELYTDDKKDIRADIFNFAVQNNYTLLTLHQQNNSLEDVFRQLTN